MSRPEAQPLRNSPRSSTERMQRSLTWTSTKSRRNYKQSMAPWTRSTHPRPTTRPSNLAKTSKPTTDSRRRPLLICENHVVTVHASCALILSVVSRSVQTHYLSLVKRMFLIHISLHPKMFASPSQSDVQFSLPFSGDMHAMQAYGVPAPSH